MKKVMVAVLAGACLISAAGISTQAFAQTATDTKKAPVRHVAKKTEKRRVTHRRAPMRKAAVVSAAAMIPAGAEKWTCDDSHALFIAGDMKRDQILTLFWDGRNYKLPREMTTTGADRFYDQASGLDLVVIPTKAMLFDDRGDRTRLADECKTRAMVEQNVPAPTQAGQLRGNK